MNFILRPWRHSDLESVAKNANNFNVTRFMSDGFPDNIEKWRSFLESVTTNRSLYLAIEVAGEAAGGIGVSPGRDIMKKNAELGYWLSEKYWGMGIITKAIKQIVSLAFDTYPEVDRIYAQPFGTNYASHRVLEKAGFILEARFEKILVKNGSLEDELVYAIRR